MFYIPYGIAEDLVFDHQRELRRDVARWRLSRSFRLRKRSTSAAPATTPVQATPLPEAQPASVGDRHTPAAA
jgi:hypothetical protein